MQQDVVPTAFEPAYFLLTPVFNQLLCSRASDFSSFRAKRSDRDQPARCEASTIIRIS